MIVKYISDGFLVFKFRLKAIYYILELFYPIIYNSRILSLIYRLFHVIFYRFHKFNKFIKYNIIF